MSPENTHKLMGFYMEVNYTLVHGFCFFKLGCIVITPFDLYECYFKFRHGPLRFH